MGFRLPTQTSAFHRWVAGLSAALVLLLAALTASPAAHHWMHEGNSDNDDGCAVVVFARGVTLAGGTALITIPLARRASAAQVIHEVFLPSPRYLLQPERGPPTRG